MREVFNHLKFELKIQRRTGSNYFFFFLFLLLSILSSSMIAGIFGFNINIGLSDKVFLNSPIMIYFLLTRNLDIGIFIVAAIVGIASCRDFVFNMNEIIYSSPISIKKLFLGRFLATYLILVFIFLSLLVGIFIATLLPNVQQELIGKNYLLNYIWAYVLAVLPNIFIFGSILFFIGTYVKKMFPVYTSSVIIFFGLNWADLFQNQTLKTLLDPSGFTAIKHLVRYWSFHQQNKEFPPLEDVFLYNRLIWIGIGLACLLFTLFRPFTKYVKN